MEDKNCLTPDFRVRAHDQVPISIKGEGLIVVGGLEIEHMSMIIKQLIMQAEAEYLRVPVD